MAEGGRALVAGLTGRKGLGPWLGLHAVLYLLLLIGWVVVLVLVNNPADPVETLLLALVVLVWVSVLLFPVYLLSMLVIPPVIWGCRELGPVRFRIVSLLVCSTPLLCGAVAPHLLWLLVPVQLTYGMVIRRPRWVHPLDREYLESSATSERGSE